MLKVVFFFAGNKLGEKGSEILWQHIANNKSLQVLDLSGAFCGGVCLHFVRVFFLTGLVVCAQKTESVRRWAIMYHSRCQR